MITYKVGDLVAAFNMREVDVLAHQANCFNTMKSGVAKAIVDEFPLAAEVDRETLRGDERKLGGFSFTRVSDGLIFNLYGQYRYGREAGVVYTQYPALGEALSNMAVKLRFLQVKGPIGLPKLGCGLAGGDWEIVEKLIEEHLADWDVFVYTLEDKQ